MPSRVPHPLFGDLFSRRNQAKAGLLESLKYAPLFKDLSHRDLRYLSQFIYERHFEAGESIFGLGERGLGVYLILEGRVSIRSRAPEGVAADGTGDERVSQSEPEMAQLGEGSFFGELALVEPDHLRTTQAIALEPTRLAGLFQPDLHAIVERKPSVGAKILLRLGEVLARRLIETHERLKTLEKYREPSHARREGL